ncbi:MAG TPA: hypothetical protein VE958_13825 [Bryobacteraceae bacterium]|jgi:hypothetical protein|nr:hypothetical protein [Bryobacteraceae bacterium]
MHIWERRNVVILLAASSTLFAQGEASPARSQSLSSAPDVRQIVEASIVATQRGWQARRHYTYIEREESRRRDLDGNLKSGDVTVSRTILVDGVPFDRLIEHNGQPPSPDEERKQNTKIDKLKRESPQQRAARLRKDEEEDMSLVRELPKAFDFQLVGEDVIKGRPAYVLQATPHPGYRPQGKYGRMFSKVEGKLWIDKEDMGWVKADGQVIQPFSMGLFLARMMRGSRITMEQTRVDNGIWMPEHIEVRAAAKIFFVKDLIIEQVLSYSEYSLPQAAAR